MIDRSQHEIPADHPIRGFFKILTERGMGQLNLRDRDTIQYITNLLTEFVQIENMYRIQDESGRRLQYLFEKLKQASNEMAPTPRRDYYKNVGDLTPFNLRLFPPHLSYGRHTVMPDYSAETGRWFYTV